MIIYLLKSGVLLSVFYVVYKFWLENEKIFRFNRAYLLTSLVFSLIIPLQLFSFKPFFSNKINVAQLEGIVIRTNNAVLNKIDYNNIMINILIVIYVTVTMILIIRFTVNLYSFYQKMTRNKILNISDMKVVLIKEPILPHSFWNIIFLNEEEFKNDRIPSELLVHESAHLQQKHTLDIFFIEVLQIFFWFNPLVILYKKAIKLNHEFLADEAVNMQFESVTTYQKLLLNIVSNHNDIALASNINYLITKKRLLMMTKKQSPFKIVLKSFSVAVLYIIILFVFSSKTVAQKISSKLSSEEQLTNTIVDPVESKPEFPGGMMAFYKFVGSAFKMPAEASKNKVTGKIYIEFIVEKDGSLSEFKAIKDLGYGLGDEAIRVLKLCPKWIPGTIERKPARVKYAMPITIQSPE